SRSSGRSHVLSTLIEAETHRLVSNGFAVEGSTRPAGGAFGSDTFGQKAEAFARFFGTPKFLIGQTAVVAAWIALNAAVVALRWDPYPFILLNLLFSTQAAYAAPLILLAQNRQADRDRAEVDRDREANARARADMDFLAREIAAIRIALQSKVDRDDVAEVMTRLDEVLDRLPQAGHVPLERE